ncbi:MAG TPA: response regulator [Myxococcales bacterium]|nr:response regulator [Myxococcales bacterium]
MSALILVIDDKELNLKLVRQLLERRGHRMVEARSAAETMERLQAERPDLILMDVQLPDVDGLTLTRELKKDPAFRDIPIIAVTSCAMPGDREQALAAGCDGYLTKPIDKNELLAVIEWHLAAG